MPADEQIGKLAQELMKTPLVTNAASAAFGAREKATQAQEAMMSALNVPSAAELEKLNKRLRSISTRLEGIEDLLDTRLEAIEKRLAAIEKSLDSPAQRSE
jgi:tetrahydromethanopterin S-methyltransferase subunit G